MADNVAVTAGSGTTIAADEVVDGTLGTVKVQYVKLMDGTLDGTSKGVVSAAGLKVDLSSTAANATAIKVDGSAVTQPVTANAGTNLNTSALALETGGNLTTIATKTTNLVTALGSTALDLGSGTGGTRTIRTIVDSSQLSALGANTMANSQPVTVASDQTPVPVKGNTITQSASSTITRPADTTPYTSGDLVANSTTAGSVVNLQFTTLARVSGGSGLIVGAQIQKSTNGVTSAAFRLHLFNTAPTYTSAGDNSAISSVVVASAKGYLGYVDITAMVAFSDVAWGSGAPDNTRGSIPYVATAQIIYGLLEARGAYTPGNAEVFTITVDALQD